MKLTALIPGFVIAVLAISTPPSAKAVVPFTENFTSNVANWTTINTATLSTYQASGGPDSSSYASVTANTTGVNAMSGALILVRGHSNANPAVAASGNAFTGNWLADGINHFSVYVYHEATESLPYFARFASTMGGNSVVAQPLSLVPARTWTQLNFDINPSQIGVTLTPSTNDPSQNLTMFNTTFSSLANIQIGFTVPGTLSPSQPYFYGIDQVSISSVVPEPSSLLLVLGGAGVGLVGLRRRRA
jgi:hypothetical protein